MSEKEKKTAAAKTATAAEPKPEVKTEAKLKAVKAAESLMYVGPTISGIGIQNRVYTEIPKEARERMKEAPEIGNLFIPIKSYPAANKMLREKNGYIYSAYTKALGLKEGGRKA